MRQKTNLDIEREFDERTKPLRCYDVTEAGIEPDHITGEFYEDRIEELKAFCEKWPFLHIISQNEFELYNRYVPGCLCYCLAQGDKDPTIEAKLGPMNRDDFEQLLDDMLKIPEDQRDWTHRFGIAWATSALQGADAFEARNMKKFYNEARGLEAEGEAPLKTVH